MANHLWVGDISYVPVASLPSAYLAVLMDRFSRMIVGWQLRKDMTDQLVINSLRQAIKARRPGPGLIHFLGFTHISRKTRRGDFTIHLKTSRKKFQAKLTELKEKLSRRSHDDLAQVGDWLQSVFRGWSQYYAVPGNYPRLQQFRDAIQKLWLRTLRRRSHRGRRLTCDKFSKLCKRWLPTPKILHLIPMRGLPVNIQGKSRMR